MQATGIRIKLVATPDNLPEATRDILNDLDKETFPLDELYSKSNCYWWIAYDSKSKPVGFAGLKPLKDENEGVGFLCRAGVLKSARGAHLQRRFIRVRERKARQIGLRGLLTYTSRFNGSSAANLFKCGYRILIPTWEWGGTGAIYFDKTF